VEGEKGGGGKKELRKKNGFSSRFFSEQASEGGKRAKKEVPKTKTYARRAGLLYTLDYWSYRKKRKEGRGGRRKRGK